MRCTLEWSRRLLALAGMLAGVWMVAWPGPPVVEVERADFARQYAQLPAWQQEGSGPEAVRRFREQRTEGRTRRVGGPDWVSLASRLGAGERRLFRAAEAPFAELAPLKEFQYLHVAGADTWLALERRWPQEVRGGAGDLGHPWRLPGLGLIVASLLLYALLPRPRHRPEVLRYGDAAAVVLPDLLGLLAGPAFAVLPALVIWSVAPGTPLFSTAGGWFWLTAVFWLMALLFLALVAVGLRFSCWRLELSGQGLIISGLGGTREVRFEAVEASAPYEQGRSRRLSRALLLFAFHPLALGMALLLRGNPERGIELQLRGRERLRIMTNALQGRERLIDALQARGIDGSGRLDPLR